MIASSRSMEGAIGSLGAHTHWSIRIVFSLEQPKNDNTAPTTCTYFGLFSVRPQRQTTYMQRDWGSCEFQNDSHTSLRAYASHRDPARSFLVLLTYFITNREHLWHLNENASFEYERSAWTAELNTSMTPQRKCECWVPTNSLNIRNHNDTTANIQI